jgi:hypothetical protein
MILNTLYIYVFDTFSFIKNQWTPNLVVSPPLASSLSLLAPLSSLVEVPLATLLLPQCLSLPPPSSACSHRRARHLKSRGCRPRT